MNAAVDQFMRVMENQPLSLALVAMNLLLIWFLFKIANMFSKTRGEVMELIVNWQKETQTIMADCVSKDVMEMVLHALERDRATYRALLPSYKVPTDETETSDKLP
jgi:hypothetical protein